LAPTADEPGVIGPDGPNLAAESTVVEPEQMSAMRELHLPTHSAAFEPPPAETAPSPPATDSFIDRYAHLFDDETSDTGTPRSEPAVSTEPQPKLGLASTGPTLSEPQRATSGDEEESIDEYMAQLMRRIRGDSIASASPAQPQPQPPADRQVYVPTTSREHPPVQEVQETERKPVEAPLTLEELRRGGPAPEQTTDMSALRELANQTARSAIGAHASRKYRENATSKLLVAGAAVASGMYLLATAPDLLSLQFVGACLAVLAALYWCTVIMRSLAEANRAKNQSRRIVAGQDPFRPELPIDAPSTHPE
jgi:hypothetical protein